jgi:hypothetical protein
VISFSVGREDFTACHLKGDLVDLQYRPIPQLLTDHLAQGVWRFCLHPEWKLGNQQPQTSLDRLDETREGISLEYDEPLEGDPVHEVASLATKLQRLDLYSRGGLDEVTRAYVQISQFSMKETERGEGKIAFEDYLHSVLSIRNDTGAY